MRRKKIENKLIDRIFYLKNKEIRIPERIGNNYIPLKIFPLSFLKQLRSHRRMRIFYKKGLKCASCEKTAKYLIEAVDSGGRKHVDLYTEEFELMTIDHIKPKSKGGSDALDNLQPMCRHCNHLKKDLYDEV